MEQARPTRWSDERMDDFAARTEARFDHLDRRMDDGFARVDADIRELRSELHSEVGALRAETSARFDAQAARFDAIQRTILQVGGGMIVTLVVGFASVLVT